MLSFKKYIEEGKRGLWDNIHAKQERIKNGSGEHMRKPGSKGAPTAHALKVSAEAVNPAQQAAIAIAMKKAGKKPKNEEVDLQFDLIEELVMELAHEHNIDPEVIWEKFETIDDEELYEAAVDAKGYKSSTGGLTQKGRDHYNNTDGGHLKAPVTTPPSKLSPNSKAAKRRKSFCARMSGVEGPMKKPNGEPSRKALALRKWNC
jgi:HPt (histidine-containing phosphotransfer) domain-containing protein